MADKLKNLLLVILLAVMIALLVLTFLVSVRAVPPDSSFCSRWKNRTAQ